MDFTSNAIVSKARAIYGNILRESDYLELLKKKSVSEVASFLKMKPNYQEKLKVINETTAHRGYLEHLIKENLFDQYMKLIRFIYLKDKSFYTLNFIRLESDLILSAIRVIMAHDKDEESFQNIPVYFDKYTKIHLEQLSKSADFNDVLDSIRKTDYYHLLLPKLVTSELKALDYLDIENILDEYYYKKSFDIINKSYKGSIRKDLLNIFQTKNEISNIIKIYRLKKFYKAAPDLIYKSLIMTFSRISKNKMEEIVRLENPSDVLKYLSKSEYNKFTDNKDYVYIEYYGEKIEYNLAKRYIYFSNKAPLTFQAFMILLETEVENIINIIEGIRYSVDESEIRQMLIY